MDIYMENSSPIMNCNVALVSMYYVTCACGIVRHLSIPACACALYIHLINCFSCSQVKHIPPLCWEKIP